jgi:hypothetical protein
VRPSAEHHWPRRQAFRRSATGRARPCVRNRRSRRGWIVKRIGEWRWAASETARRARKFYFCRQSANWASAPWKKGELLRAPIGRRARLASNLHPADSHWPLRGGLLQRRGPACTANYRHSSQQRRKPLDTVKNSRLSCRTLSTGHNAVNLCRHHAGHWRFDDEARDIERGRARYIYSARRRHLQRLSLDASRFC